MSVSDIIASADIVVFQSPSCPYCRMAISALLEAGYEPTIIDASSSQRSELLEITSRSSVPSIWVKGKYVGGCNDGPEPWMGIRKLLANGQLADMLNQGDL